MIIVLTVAIIVLVFFGLFTQVLLPLVQNRKLFPIFRTNELRNEVQELENETEDLEDKVTALEILAKLKARRNQLESEVAKHTKDNVPAEDSTPTKEN